MNNNNYLFYHKYFDFEKSNLSQQNCINEILLFNNDLEKYDLDKLEKELNWINNNEILIKRRNIENLKFINKSILKSELIEVDISDCGNSSIYLNTTYPGLLLGTGYSHDYKAGNEDVTQEGFKIGFYFDFTTGMPVIPGSSVKGMLRSCFPQSVIASKNGRNKKPKYSKEKEEFIKDELKNLGITEDIDIDIFESEIFDGLRPQKDIEGKKIKDEKEKLKYKPFSIYKRDTFFEAIPTTIHNSKKVLFEDDALAVHKENLLKNPTPIKFLKVAPNVEYQFQFRLFKSEIFPTITAGIKRELFERLILTFGIGAKTNVGYGQFTFADNAVGNNVDENSFIDSQKEKEIREILEKHLETEKNKTEAEKRLVKGAKIDCTVIAKDKNYYTFGVDWDNNLTFKKKTDRITIPLKPGDTINIEISEDYYIRQEVSFSNNITKI